MEEHLTNKSLVSSGPIGDAWHSPKFGLRGAPRARPPTLRAPARPTGAEGEGVARCCVAWRREERRQAMPQAEHLLLRAREAEEAFGGQPDERVDLGTRPQL